MIVIKIKWVKVNKELKKLKDTKKSLIAVPDKDFSKDAIINKKVIMDMEIKNIR